jgi:hypothetical protein
MQGFSATLHELEVGRPWLLDIPDLFLRYIPPHRIHSIREEGESLPISIYTCNTIHEQPRGLSGDETSPASQELV